MEFALSTHLFIGQRLSSQVLDKILGFGIQKIEIFAARQHLNYHDPDHVGDLASWFRDHGLELLSLHAPLFADSDWGRSGGAAVSIAYTEKRRRIDSMDEIKRAVEVADQLPFRYLVLHMGLFGEAYGLEKFDAAFTSLEHLKIFAKERGVEIILENIPNELSTPERLVQFARYTHMDGLKFCFDTGHAHMGGGVHEAFETLKDRVVSTHVHDNQKEKDDHLLPFDGGIDWERTIQDFRSLDGRFPILFELRDYGPEKSSLPHLRAVMDRMEAVR
jgi:sugar phosphate isomerase/epimerase